MPRLVNGDHLHKMLFTNKNQSNPAIVESPKLLSNTQNGSPGNGGRWSFIGTILMESTQPSALLKSSLRYIKPVDKAGLSIPVIHAAAGTLNSIGNHHLPNRRSEQI